MNSKPTLMKHTCGPSEYRGGRVSRAVRFHLGVVGFRALWLRVPGSDSPTPRVLGLAISGSQTLEREKAVRYSTDRAFRRLAVPRPPERVVDAWGLNMWGVPTILPQMQHTNHDTQR